MDDEKDIMASVLVVLGWILPLFGSVWGPGAWWQYALWLLLGTVAILAYSHFYLVEKKP